MSAIESKLIMQKRVRGIIERERGFSSVLPHIYGIVLIACGRSNTCSLITNP